MLVKAKLQRKILYMESFHFRYLCKFLSQHKGPWLFCLQRFCSFDVKIYIYRLLPLLLQNLFEATRKLFGIQNGLAQYKSPGLDAGDNCSD